ncbi:MAG: glycosyltransferase family 4 protein [Planctomycetota bacterium]|nr:glycosyltransferase family 4 protein [Planctomycetota bacterium]
MPTLLHLRDSIVPKIAFSSLAGNLTAYVAISDYMQSVLSDYLSVPGHKIFRINNGVHMPSPPSAEERRKARKNLGYEPDEIAFLSASAFVPWKNQRSFLDAYKTVKNKIPNSRIVICGDDISGENSNVASRINSGVRGLGDLAEAPGYVEDLTPYFHAADVFVHPAIGEPFGRVVVEAQAAGLPVVCYRSGSMEQVVAEGETGLIAELEAKKLGEKLLQIAKDEELRARLASNAPRHAAQFSVEKCVQGIYDLYGKMVSGDLPQPEKKQKKPTPQKELLRQRQLRDRKRKETTQ